MGSFFLVLYNLVKSIWDDKIGKAGCFFIGMIVALILGGILPYFFGKNLNDMRSFMVSEGMKAQDKEFNEFLVTSKNLYLDLSKISERRQAKLWRILQESKLSPTEIGEILNINYRDRDILRAYLEYIEMLFPAANEGRISGKMVGNVSRLARAYTLIHEDSKSSKENAIEEYESLYREITGNERCQLEILRNITYCYFALNRTDNIKFWQDQAVKIRTATHREYGEYSKRYFWVDLNALHLAVQATPYNEKEAEIAFKRLESGMPGDLLKTKLMQHKLNIKSENAEKWECFIERLK